MEREFCSPGALIWPPARAHAGPAPPAPGSSPCPGLQRGAAAISMVLRGVWVPITRAGCSATEGSHPRCLLPSSPRCLARRSRCDAGRVRGREQRCSGVGQLILDGSLGSSRSYVGCLYIGLPYAACRGKLCTGITQPGVMGCGVHHPQLGRVMLQVTKLQFPSSQPTFPP